MAPEDRFERYSMKIRIKLFADFAEKMPAEQDAEGSRNHAARRNQHLRRARSLRDTIRRGLYRPARRAAREEIRPDTRWVRTLRVPAYRGGIKVPCSGKTQGLTSPLPLKMPSQREPGAEILLVVSTNCQYNQLIIYGINISIPFLFAPP